ncbi:energy transducer TonB [Photobacterium gaetbulicola]|uniref:Protein TonB n=1 Tax=Photobacterium gaetbulicola Gung47 TaxID=658445 RepID=A0A0C5WSC4_9GAMM|nr:energy transducer TonB [Photobacterium gaetbulicola]AJR05910.1 putative TonB2 protein [Photobacterium gaetbulicola Gung47]PSU13277.1 energy transducer TonB [Photobacterium gaetbulicola]
MLRVLIAIPAAFLMALGLFTFMAWMVDNGSQRPEVEKQLLAFDMVMVEQEREAQRRQRTVPEPPETPEPPPQAMPQAMNQAVSNTIVPSMPNLNLDASVSGLAINAPTFSDFGANQQAMPLYRVEPKYPSRAMKQGAEGYVVMSFTIDPQGRPTDISVLDAKPRRLFEREAIQALRKWKYQPKVVDGKSIAQAGQTVRLEFKIQK